jgi:hypothetical protein
VSICDSTLASFIVSQYDSYFLVVVVYIGSHIEIPASASTGKTVAKGKKKSTAIDAPSKDGTSCS